MKPFKNPLLDKRGDLSLMRIGFVAVLLVFLPVTVALSIAIVRAVWITNTVPENFLIALVGAIAPIYLAFREKRRQKAIEEELS